MADTAKLADFITANKITMSCVRTNHNSNMESTDMDYWKCTVQRPDVVDRSWTRKIRMTVTFSQGYGHKGAEPKLDSVLDCLASDAAGIENAGDFEEWCSEYGYDADSRKAEKTYNACEHQSERLKTFLGQDLYDALLWHTERE